MNVYGRCALQPDRPHDHTIVPYAESYYIPPTVLGTALKLTKGVEVIEAKLELAPMTCAATGQIIILAWIVPQERGPNAI